MFEFEELVAFAANLHGRVQGSIETALTTCGLNARMEVAKRVGQRFPEFLDVVRIMDKTGRAETLTAIGDGLVEEYRAMQAHVASEASLMRDADFLALLMGMAGFMERFEQPQNNGARIVAALLRAHNERICDEAACALVAMGLWFSDYNGYRDAVRNA